MLRLVFIILILAAGAILYSSCSSFSSTTHIRLDSLKVSNLNYDNFKTFELKPVNNGSN